MGRRGFTKSGRLLKMGFPRTFGALFDPQAGSERQVLVTEGIVRV